MVGSVYARIQPGQVSCQHFLSPGPVLEWPLDGPFTRDEIPLIHRVKKSAVSKPGLGFSFAFAYRSHGRATLKRYGCISTLANHAGGDYACQFQTGQDVELYTIKTKPGTACIRSKEVDYEADIQGRN